jgi:hypothetical protein
MRKSKLVAVSTLLSLIMFFMIGVQNIYAQQTGKTSQPIPDDLKKIFTHSCFPCHSANGSGIAKSMVNFDSWSNLSADKQATKAGKISKAVNSGYMPKKSAREKNPDIIPTKDQIAIVTKWAESLNPVKK